MASGVERLARIAFFGAALFAFVMAVLPHPPMIPGNPPDKLQHMLAFATLGVVGAIGFARRSAWSLFLMLTGFGAFIELVQALPMIHRDCDIRDLIADMIAAAIALALTRAIARRARRL